MNTTHQEYTYFAFISYKREDEKWAKWLQKKLESYGFPVSLRKENPSLPAKIRPIFRDQSELSGGNLKEEIEKGLAGSKYLIVICSPRAAKSPWVSKEVQYFIDHGKEEYIIPFIIGGYPNAANPEDECFPEGLRQLSGEREILGVNINEMGRDAAAIKVIARMFCLRFDTLWQRHERAKRRKRFAVVISVILFAIVGFGVGAYMIYLNTQIIAERDRAEIQTMIANNERNRANIERDNALKANINLAQAKDSILMQANIIVQANKNLEKSIRDLAIERDHVLKANLGMRKNQGRTIAEKARSLMDDGDIHTALTILWEFENLTKGDSTLLLVPEIEEQMRRGLYLYSIGEGQSVCSFSTPSLINKVYLTPENNYILSANNDGKIHIWDYKTKKELRPFVGGSQYDCKNLAISGDGKYIAFGGSLGHELFIYNILTREIYKKFQNQYIKNIYAYKFSPDNSYIAIGGLSTLSVINLKSGDFKGISLKDDSYINSIDFNSDGSQIITGMGDGKTKIWDARSLVCQYIMNCGSSSVNAAKFVNDSIVLTGGDNIYKWNLKTLSGELLTTYTPNEHDIMEIVLHANKTDFAFCQRNGDVFLCNLNNHKLRKKLDGNAGACFGLAYDKNGDNLITGYYNNIIKIWDIHTTTVPNILNYEYPICCKFMQNNRMCVLTDYTCDSTFCFKYQFRIWDSVNNKLIMHFPYDTVRYDSFVLNTDESIIALQTGYNTSIINWREKSMLTQFKGEALAFHPNYNKLLISRNDSLYEISLADINNPVYITEHSSTISSANYNQEGNKVITSSWDKTVKIIDMTNRNCTHTIQNDQCVCVAKFSPDGKYIISGGQDGQVHIYNALTYAEIKCFNGYTHWVKSANFSPDGRFLITASAHQIIIWDLLTMNRLETIPEVVLNGYADFTKDGKYIYFCGKKGVKIYKFRSHKEVLTEVESIVNSRILTTEEKTKYNLE